MRKVLLLLFSTILLHSTDFGIAVASPKLVFDKRVKLFSGLPNMQVYGDEMRRIAFAPDGLYYSYRFRPAVVDGSESGHWQSIQLYRFGSEGTQSIVRFPLCGLPEVAAELFSAEVTAVEGGVLLVYSAQCQSESGAYWDAATEYILWNPEGGKVKQGPIDSVVDGAAPTLASSVSGDEVHIARAQSTNGASQGKLYYYRAKLSALDLPLRQVVSKNFPFTGTSAVRFGHFEDGTTHLYARNGERLDLYGYSKAGKLLFSKKGIRPNVPDPLGKSVLLSVRVNDVASFEEENPLALFVDTFRIDDEGKYVARLISQRFQRDGSPDGKGNVLIELVSIDGFDNDFQSLIFSNWRVAVEDGRVHFAQVDDFNDTSGRSTLHYYELKPEGTPALSILFRDKQRMYGPGDGVWPSIPYSAYPRHGQHVRIAVPVTYYDSETESALVEMQFKLKQ